jgi:hypothetical protein
MFFVKLYWLPAMALSRGGQQKPVAVSGDGFCVFAVPALAGGRA